MDTNKIEQLAEQDATVSGYELSLEQLKRAVESKQEADEALINALTREGVQNLFGCSSNELSEACALYNEAHRACFAEIYSARAADES